MGGSRGEGGLAGVGAQLLGAGGLESLKSKGLGLLERISSARAAAGAAGGAQAGQGGEPATLEDIGNMLKVWPQPSDKMRAGEGWGRCAHIQRAWKLPPLLALLLPLSHCYLSRPSPHASLSLLCLC